MRRLISFGVGDAKAFQFGFSFAQGQAEAIERDFGAGQLRAVFGNGGFDNRFKVEIQAANSSGKQNDDCKQDKQKFFMTVLSAEAKQIQNNFPKAESDGWRGQLWGMQIYNEVYIFILILQSIKIKNPL